MIHKRRRYLRFSLNMNESTMAVGAYRFYNTYLFECPEILSNIDLNITADTI